MLRPFLAMSALLWSAWSLPDFAAVLAAGLGVMPLAFFWAGCPCCTTAECPLCNTGTTPAQVQLEVSGIYHNTALSSYCSNCDGYNATFVLDAVDGEFSVSECGYLLSLSPTLCMSYNGTSGLDAVAVYAAFVDFFGTERLEAYFYGTNQFTDVGPVWRQNVAIADCSTFSSESVAFSTNSNANECKSDGTAVLFSSL